MLGKVERNTVFVIDEDPAIYKALCRIGEQQGFSAEAFSNSRSFFTWLETASASNVLDGYSICLVLDAKTLVGEMDWYTNELVRSIPKICIGIPEEVKSIIEMLTVLEGQFIRRPFTMEELRQCVAMAFVRYAAIVRDIQENFLISEHFSKLSGRENEVFNLVAQGRTNQEISDLLGISIKTVKAHRSKVMKKTQSRTIADLVRNYEKRKVMLSNGQKHKGKPA